MLDNIQTQLLDNEIRKAKKMEEALFLKRDAEERAEAEEEDNEILESATVPDVGMTSFLLL